jgi:hypothetical protein
MKFWLAAMVMSLGMGCATGPAGVVKTRVVTFPEGALVEYNGTALGRAPASVVLPQDAEGRLTQRAVVRAVPNTNQDRLYAQSRVFDPTNRMDRVPNRILIDMRLRGTNEPVAEVEMSEVVREESKPRSRHQFPYVDRSKPTQAVGLDRWNPGRK